MEIHLYTTWRENTGKTKYFTRIVFLEAFIHKVNVVCIEKRVGGKEICAVNKVLQYKAQGVRRKRIIMEKTYNNDI